MTPEEAAERLALVRLYVQNNRDVWGEGHSPLEKAYTDIYQKVLNVIDTGHPLHEAKA